MALNTLNTDGISFKKLGGKSHTQQNFSISEEGISTNVQSSYSTVFSNSIEPLPVTNSGLTSEYDTNGIVERVRFEVDIIPDTQIAVNRSQGYRLKLPADYNTSGGELFPIFSAGTYLHNAVGKLQIVPSLYGQLKLDGTTEYDPILYQTNGNTVIAKFDPINWYLDPYSGILFVQDPPAGYDISASRPGFVEAYLYVGNYLDDILFSIASGNTGTTGLNVGGAQGVFKDTIVTSGGTSVLRFKSLFGTNGVSVTGDSDNVFVSFSGLTGLLTGATNGLTANSTDVRLGGALTGNTTISGSSGATLTFAGYPVNYGNDYSVDYTARSLVDAGFVTGITSTLTSNVDNGLSLDGNTIVLGGALTGDTNLNTSGNTLSITSSSNEEFLHVKYFSTTEGDNIGANYYGTGSYDVIEDTQGNIWASDINGTNALWRYNKITKSSSIYSTSVAGQGSGPNLPANIVYALGFDNEYLLAPTYGGGLWLYNITGNSSQIFNNAGGANSGSNLPDDNTYAAVSDGTYAYVATEIGGVWRLNLNTLVADIFNNAGGANSGTNLPSDDVYVLTINNGSLYAGTSSGIWRLNLGTLVGSVYNTSGGANTGPDLTEDFVFPLRSVDDYIIAGTSASGIWVYNTITNVSQIFSTSSGSQDGLNLLDDAVGNISVDPVTNTIYVEGQNFIGDNGRYWTYSFNTNISNTFRPTTDIIGIDGLINTAQSKLHFGTDSQVWFAFSGIFLNSLFSGVTRTIEHGVSGVSYSNSTLIKYLQPNSLTTLEEARNKTFKFSNGLVKTSSTFKEFNAADDVKLGGTMGSTSLSLTGGTFNIRNINSIGNNALSVSTGSTEIGFGTIFPSQNRSRILFTTNSCNIFIGALVTTFGITDNRTQKRGLEYNNISSAEYSGFSANSLAPVGYVTGLTTPLNVYNPRIIISGNTTLTSNDFIILADSNASGFTISLPSSPVDGQAYKIKDVGDALTNNIFISGNGKNIDSSPTITINTQRGGFELCYDSTINEWFVLNFIG